MPAPGEDLKNLRGSVDTASNVSSVTPLPHPTELQYIRVCFGGESGEPGLTLYEVDRQGWVHRHAQVHMEGARFAPEEILMCSPVNMGSMLTHPAAETIDVAQFELFWNELAPDREFLSRVPDPESPWEGWMRRGADEWHLLWTPNDEAPKGWSVVPGFRALFVEGGPHQARRAAAAIFTESPIRWTHLSAVAA